MDLVEIEEDKEDAETKKLKKRKCMGNALIYYLHCSNTGTYTPGNEIKKIMRFFFNF